MMFQTCTAPADEKGGNLVGEQFANLQNDYVNYN